ncbi:hypothetical protein BG58_11085 [Caballeronia jiangsuensis]|nr:hypothetical protein BG58_11085 [Caballeronia jiangsuensis]
MTTPYQVILRNIPFGDEHEAFKQYLADTGWHERHDVGDFNYADSSFSHTSNAWATLLTGFDDEAEAMLFKLTFSEYL